MESFQNSRKLSGPLHPYAKISESVEKIENGNMELWLVPLSLHYLKTHLKLYSMYTNFNFLVFRCSLQQCITCVFCAQDPDF